MTATTTTRPVSPAGLTDTDELHWPGRVDCLEPLEEHVRRAARLSRALWNAIEPAGFKDERDRWALHELTADIADHASAAYFVLCRDADSAAAAPAPIPAPAVGPTGDAPSPLDTAYELALNQKNRSAGLATLLDAAFDARRNNFV